ncbi:MAG TPA: mannose-1-phosphate guanylyltransferase [Gemmataceae bacterium]|nr:mannose-1-phosphate guanylyltransferase [Gemmataceae bacterium]
MLHAMIMAGGGGTRFWPRSRKQRPKQFLALGGERTLLQQAMDRIEGLLPAERTWVITGQAYQAETCRQLPQLSADHIIGEPCGRDTAPCIGLGAVLIARGDADAVMLVTPADHVIEPVREFERAARVAALMAEENASTLITLGIPPTFPSTGYGYIHRGAEIGQRQGVSIFRVQRFEEKPAADRAERFVTSGEYYWNSGIFVWRVAAVLDELRRQQPQLHDAVRRIADAWDTPRRSDVLRQQYEGLSKLSIDYAVMERAREVLMVKAPYRWDDVGSWLALERMNPQDADHNTVLATHCGLKTNHCIIVSDAGRLITTIGVENLVIVQDGDATLITDRRDEGTVKQLVELLKKKGLDQYL